MYDLMKWYVGYICYWCEYDGCVDLDIVDVDGMDVVYVEIV